MSHFFVATALMTAFTQEPGGVEQAKGPARREGLEDWTQSVGSWSIKDSGQSFADRSLDMENGDTMGHGIPLKWPERFLALQGDLEVSNIHKLGESLRHVFFWSAALSQFKALGQVA